MGNPRDMKVRKAVWGSLKSGKVRLSCIPTSWGCFPPSPSVLSTVRGRTDFRPPNRQDQGGPGAEEACQHRGQETERGFYSPAAPCPVPCHTLQESTMEEDTAPGLLAPAFSRRLATQSTRAPDSCGYPGATPATFEFQPPPPFSPPSARQGQSSPSPEPRTNRSALRLPRPHPARRAPSPSCFAGFGEIRWLVTLPAPLPPPSPFPPVAVVALHFRSAPRCRALRQKSAWNAPHERSWCGGRSAGGKESRVRKRGPGSGAGRDKLSPSDCIRERTRYS